MFKCLADCTTESWLTAAKGRTVGFSSFRTAEFYNRHTSAHCYFSCHASLDRRLLQFHNLQHLSQQGVVASSHSLVYNWYNYDVWTMVIITCLVDWVWKPTSLTMAHHISQGLKDTFFMMWSPVRASTCSGRSFLAWAGSQPGSDRSHADGKGLRVWFNKWYGLCMDYVTYWISSQLRYTSSKKYNSCIFGGWININQLGMNSQYRGRFDVNARSDFVLSHMGKSEIRIAAIYQLHTRLETFWNLFEIQESNPRDKFEHGPHTTKVAQLNAATKDRPRWSLVLPPWCRRLERLRYPGGAPK